MTEFDQSVGDNSLDAQLAASRDGEERGAIWREIIIGDPQAFEAKVKYASAMVTEAHIEGLVGQASSSVADEAAAAAEKARNPDT